MNTEEHSFLYIKAKFTYEECIHTQKQTNQKISFLFNTNLVCLIYALTQLLVVFIKHWFQIPIYFLLLYFIVQSPVIIYMWFLSKAHSKKNLYDNYLKDFPNGLDFYFYDDYFVVKNNQNFRQFSTIYSDYSKIQRYTQNDGLFIITVRVITQINESRKFDLTEFIILNCRDNEQKIDQLKQILAKNNVKAMN